MSAALLAAWTRTLRRHGRARAIVQAADAQTCTFRELDARAAALGFDRRGLAGRAVVFAEPNGIRWFEVSLALLRAGAVAVPLDAAEPAEARRGTAEALRAGFLWDGGKLVALARPRRFRDPETCLIKLTSGTTGRPRPLVFTAAQLLADARHVTRTMGIGGRDLNYALIPLGHSYGLGNLVLPLLAHGVPLVCGTAPLPQAIAADFARWRPTVFPGVPAVWRALAAADTPRGSFASLRLAISAGAPLGPEIAGAFAVSFGRRLHAFYGASETGGIAYDRTGAATLAGGVGRALRGVRIAVRRGQRISVTSAAVFTVGNRRGGAWEPADRVALGPRGELTLLGRRGATVKIAGRRVSLGEVTLRVRALAGVREAWAGVPAGTEASLGAVVATTRTVPELRAELHATTAAWKIPKKWIVLAALPVTARGKPDVRAMQALLDAPR
jgi:acyl-coenzyme A synthetase/AMP-(fatty) acid ligase